MRTLPIACALAALALPVAAHARPAGADRDGRPNILVVMTDDQAKADVANMPNVKPASDTPIPPSLSEPTFT